LQKEKEEKEEKEKQEKLKRDQQDKEEKERAAREERERAEKEDRDLVEKQKKEKEQKERKEKAEKERQDKIEKERLEKDKLKRDQEQLNIQKEQIVSLINSPVVPTKTEDTSILKDTKAKDELKFREDIKPGMSDRSGPYAGIKSPDPTGKKYGNIEKCDVCGQTVYLIEKVVIEGKILHSNCLRCAHCSNKLSAGKYASLAGKYYCKPHFKQLFALKGNYAEGFGEEKPQTKWLEAKENDNEDT